MMQKEKIAFQWEGYGCLFIAELLYLKAAESEYHKIGYSLG